MDGLLEQLSRADAGTAADAVNAALGELQDRATASSLVGEASGRIKRLVERNEASLEELVAETARQTEDDLQATLAGFKEQLRQLRDGMARAGADESLDARALYERIVGILRRAAAQG